MRTFFLAIVIAGVLLWGAPEFVLAAEEAASINPPGWVGGLLAIIAVGLAVGTGVWVRNKRL